MRRRARSGGLTGSLGLVTVQGGHVNLQPFVSDSEIQNADEPVVDLTAEERLLFTDKLGKDIRDVNFTPGFSAHRRDCERHVESPVWRCG